MKAAIGRPRDPRIDDAVIDATLTLVQERGYAGVSIDAIADAAGTTKPAIYRRWSTKAHLVHEAVFAGADLHGLPDTGAMANDVREMLRRIVSAFTTPAARAALPGLVGEIVADPTLHAALLSRFAPVFGELGTRLEAARRRGEIREDVDATAVTEMLTGMVLGTVLLRSMDALDNAWVERSADLVTRGLTR